MKEITQKDIENQPGAVDPRLTDGRTLVPVRLAQRAVALSEVRLYVYISGPPFLHPQSYILLSQFE